jgi:hypothetical protein
MNYQSQALQDRFAANITKFKRAGYYLDIGSCDAVSTNNTFCFEDLGWKGICVEIDSAHNDSYRQRTCKYINGDATTLDYQKLLSENNAPKTIDYLSLDIDHMSTAVLEKLPLADYIFNIITIEHDFYIHGGIYRDAQRKILADAGYILLCADVLVPITHDTKPDCSFEDWWVHQSFMSQDVQKIMSNKLYPEQIISMFQ